MHCQFKNERGSIIVLFACALLILMLFAALSIDVSSMLTAKNQLQSAVDASALAGASGLVIDQTEACNRAITFGGLNDCINQNVQINPADISFPAANRIRVQGNHMINLYFARVIGMNTTTISAVAEAALDQLVGSGGARPWAVPDQFWQPGDKDTLKCGALGATGTNSGFFYPVDFPAINKGTPEVGAQIYEDNIANGTNYTIEIGDILQVEPGNMIGPTKQGLDDLIAKDPTAYWDPNKGNSGRPISVYGQNSPRIVIIPLYDANLPPDSGRNTVTVIGLAAFFIDQMAGNNVIGYFMEYTTSGKFGSGNTMLSGAKLVL